VLTTGCLQIANKLSSRRDNRDPVASPDQFASQTNQIPLDPAYLE
jgi:hypothetical protein